MKILLSAISCLGLAVLPAGAALLNNGDFNTGDLTGWWSYGADPTNQSVTVQNVAGFSYDGTPYAYAMNRTDASAVIFGQEVDVAGGSQFGVSLRYRATNWGGGGVEILYYDASWARLGDLYGWIEGIGYQWAGVYTGDGTDTGWLSFTSPMWTAPVQTAHISVRVHDWGWADGYFDDVVLTVVPEPGCAALLGLAGLAVLAWRLRKP